MKANDNWIPACDGLEKPFTIHGTRWLYVWNPGQRIHGYLNLDTDMVETSRDFHPTNLPYFVETMM